MADEKNIIWASNGAYSIYDDIKEARDAGDEEYVDYSDNELYGEAYRLNDEKANLESVKGHFVARGTIVRWNGSGTAWKDLGNCSLMDAVSEVMRSFDGDNTFTVYVDSKGDVVIEQYGHDNPVSPSIMSVRRIKASVLEKYDYDIDGIIHNISDRAFARRTERVGGEVGRIYGWKEVA